jgi:hypothetical protein
MTGLASFGGPATPHIKEKRQRQPDSLSLRTVPRKSNDPSNTAGFLLSKIGKAATERFAEKIAPLGLRPKHCGVLALSPLSQQELARILDLVPSAIVTIVDELKALNAVERVEDPSDRRRYTIELTHRLCEVAKSDSTDGRPHSARQRESTVNRALWRAGLRFPARVGAHLFAEERDGPMRR